MATDVNAAFRYVLGNEVSKRPDGSWDGKIITDSDGGLTRYGFDSLSNPDLVERGFYTVDAATALTMAEDAFKYDLWNMLLCYNISEQAVATKFCDLAFNQGVHEATLIMQRSVNSLRDTANQILVDGIPGSRTVAAINAVEPEDLSRAIVEYGTEFYSGLLQQNPEKFSKIYNGWIARLEKMPVDQSEGKDA